MAKIERVIVSVMAVTDDGRAIDRSDRLEVGTSDVIAVAAQAAMMAAYRVADYLTTGGSREADRIARPADPCAHVAEDHIPLDIDSGRPCGIGGCGCLALNGCGGGA